MAFLNITAVAVWLLVTAYFARRYLQKRLLVSLSLAAMALGWAVLAGSTFIGDAAWNLTQPYVSLGSLFLGYFVLYSIVRVETHKR